jgi:hypothetical protein
MPSARNAGSPPAAAGTRIRASTTTQPSGPMITGFRSSSTTSGKQLGELPDPDDDVVNPAGVQRWAAVRIEQTRPGAELAEHLHGVHIGQRHEPVCPVGDQIRGGATEADRDQRAEHRVTDHPDQQFGTGRRHRLHEQPAQPRPEAGGQRGRGLGDRLPVGETEAHPAGCSLVCNTPSATAFTATGRPAAVNAATACSASAARTVPNTGKPDRPELITRSARTPARPHCRATSGTTSAGRHNTARSTGRGTSSIDRWQVTPHTCPACGFTAASWPVNPAWTRLSSTTCPTESGRRPAPTTTIERAASTADKLATSARSARSASATR